MKKVVWSGIVATFALVCLGTVPAAAQGKHPAPVEKRAARRFKKLDQNGNGVIDRSEWTRKPKAFDRIDTDHDGTVSPEEFRRFIAKRARRR